MTLQRKQIGERNGLKIFTRLKAKKRMNATSKKQTAKNNELNKARKSLKAMAGELCMNCHQPPDFRGLQVHHLKLRSKGGTNALSNLILLCAKCHNEVHGIREN